MTNDLDNARVKEALRLWDGQIMEQFGLIAARLAREGWTPPVAVDPDLLEARKISERINRDAGYPPFADSIRLGEEDNSEDVLCAIKGIKRGRELERAEAKPGINWLKHDGSKKNPLDRRNSWILVNRVQRGFGAYYSSNDAIFDWRDITHYAEITPPEDVA